MEYKRRERLTSGPKAHAQLPDWPLEHVAVPQAAELALLYLCCENCRVLIEKSNPSLSVDTLDGAILGADSLQYGSSRHRAI